MKVLEFSRVL